MLVGRLLQELHVEGVPEDRRQGGQAPDRVGEAADAQPDQLADIRRHLALVQRGGQGPAPGGLSGQDPLVPEIVDELGHRQRHTLALRLQEAGQLGRPRLADQRLRDLGEIRGFQPAQFQPRRPAGLLATAEDLAQGVVPVQLVHPAGGDDPDRPLEPGEEEHQQVERVAVREVEIVEEQDQRIAAAAHAVEEARYRGEEPPPVLEARHRLRLREVRPQVAQLGDEADDILQHLGGHLREGPGSAFGLRRQRAAQDLEKWPVGHQRAHLMAPPGKHAAAPLRGGGVEERLDQPGLADPRLAGDQGEMDGAGERAVPPFLQLAVGTAAAGHGDDRPAGGRLIRRRLLRDRLGGQAHQLATCLFRERRDRHQPVRLETGDLAIAVPDLEASEEAHTNLAQDVYPLAEPASSRSSDIRWLRFYLSPEPRRGSC